MGSIRARDQRLFFDFRYQGVRCREQTLLKDTKLNRARLEKNHVRYRQSHPS